MAGGIGSATLEAMIAAGLSPEQMLAIVRGIEADAKPKDPGAAVRMANMRARRKAAAQGEDVTRNVTPNPPNDIYSNPPSPSEPIGSSGGVRGKRATKTQIPPDFEPVMSGITLATVDGWPPGRLAEEVEHFIDHHSAKGNTSLDWQANWRTWVKNSKKWEPRNGHQPTNDQLQSPIGRALAANERERSGYPVQLHGF